MTEPIEQSDFDNALELLPWYAKGQLSTEESTWISNQLEKSEPLRSELSLIKKQILTTENYIDQIDTSAYENKPERLSAIINQFEKKESTSQNNKTDKKSLWAKLLSYLPQTQGSWQVAGALALGIMIIQGVVISQLYQDKPKTEYTTLSGEDPDNGTTANDKPSFLTRFNLNASVYQVDELLNKYSLNINGGPDAGGIYRLSYIGNLLDEEAIDKMVAELEAQDKIIRFIAREN